MDEYFTESLVYSDSDNSDGEGPATSTHIPEPNLSSSPEKSNQDLKNHINGVSEDSDEEDIQMSMKKTKKNARILSSDDEEENSSNEAHREEKDTTESLEPTESTSNFRPSICDSDTKSSSDGHQSDTEIQTKKKSKKLKKKKKRIQKQKEASSDSGSDSENDSGSSEDDKENRNKSEHKRIQSSNQTERSGDSSGSDSSSADSNDQTENAENPKPREKTVQRMSAKMAEQQMKEIQSESQRMARQLHVNIPYHKPKSHSLKEFLNRRSIVQQQEKLASKSIVKAAVAIKMSGDQLIQYMDEMKKREKEAEEFFQQQEVDDVSSAKLSDSDDDEDYTGETSETATKLMEDDEKSEELTSEVQPNIDMNVECENIQDNLNTSATQIDAELNKPEECINQDISENAHGDQSDNPINPDGTRDVIELHTNQTELDDELDAAITNKKVKLTFPTDFVPKLKGEKGFVIDFETNDVKPVPKTGVDELFERFMGNAVVKPQRVETQDIGIFRTDTGSIEKHTLHVNVDNITSKREPRPGESLFKLRAELGKKIKENREKLIAQRLQEEKEQELTSKQMESEDDEQEFELSDDEKACNEPEEQMEQPVDENMESENDMEDSEDDESENADLEIEANAVQKPRKRILTTMDDDSDNPESENPTDCATIEDENISQPIENHSTQLPSEEEPKSMNISELESEILQLSNVTDTESNKKETSKLFDECDADYEDIGESQLMELCSGSFATQHLDKPSVQDIEQSQKDEPVKLNAQVVESEEVVPTKPIFSSSDEEESNENENIRKKSRNKRKQHTLVYSDDEGEEENKETMDKEQDESECLSNIEDEEEIVEDEEEDLGERYIEYDSDENEIEVEMKKKDVRKKASDFVENEAELSESEWGSDDEEEQGLNRYEAELGDADKFDKEKLKGELERIRLREQTDQDSREIRILTERFIEEEDGGQERERKFRWKHLNNADPNDDQVQNINQDEVGLDNSDDENEAAWRRMRYEREQLLKQQMGDDKDLTIEQVSTTIGVAEQTTNKNVSTTIILNSSKRISIIKPVGASTSKSTSPFLITNGGLNMMHYSRKSFLNRDSPILEKLASLSKAGTENDAILNTAKGKGNYVFVATEKKDSSKRKSDSEFADNLGVGPMNPSKKSKLDPKGAKMRPQTKAFFESLN